MRLGFIINTCEPFYRGGYETRTWEFARALAARGHDVTLFTSCPQAQTIDGVHFEPLVPPRRYFNRRGVRNLYADVLFAAAVLKLSRWDGEFDVIDACATPFIHLFPLAHVCRMRRWPFVATCHEALQADIDSYIAERGVTGGLFSRIYARLLRGIYRAAQRQPGHLLAVSHATARGLAQEGWGVVPVVEFGLREMPDTMPSKPDHARTQLINVGRHTPIKRLDVVLHALALVQTRTEAFHLHLVGSGAMESAWRQLAADLGLSAHVTFHSTLSDAERDKRLDEADLFLLGSVREGFSIATIEAMAHGCAVIAASAPPPARPNAVLDYLHDGGNSWIADGRAESFAEQILAAIQDRSRLRVRQHAAFVTAQSYRLKDKVTQLESFYRTIALAKV
ncbi:MAG: hypothetical protein B9S32_17035 [Verrucomicrobia bacterium Tous-C9LFEB]|nr:MAG: hypothetical protein B9S32_17035 [Verrucomicrobia bacterium Tous-C9LFEB]